MAALDTLDTSAETPAGPLTKLETAKPQFSIMGSKVGALSPDQSGDIKAKLLEMIAAREAEKKGLGYMSENLMQFAGPAENWAANRQAVNETRKNRENDIMAMRLGIANMESEQQRIAQQRAQDAQDQAMMMQAMGLTPPPAAAAPAAAPVAAAAPAAAAEGQPAAAAEGQPAGMPPELTKAGATPFTAGLAATLSPQQKVGIMGQFRENKSQGWKAFLEAVKPTDLQRELGALGLPQETVNGLIIAAKSGDAFKPVSVVNPQTGYKEEISLIDLINRKAPTGGRPAAPAAPAAVAQPAAPAAVQPAAPAAVAQPAAASTAAVNTPSRAPFGSEEWRKEQAAKAEADIAIQKQAIEARGTEDAKQTTALQTAVDKASERMPQIDRSIEMLDKHGEVFGKLMKPTTVSAVMNAASQGIPLGPLGNVNLPWVNEVGIQMSPYARKHPEAIEAWNTVNSTVKQVLGDYTAITNKGQGAVSNQERGLYAAAVGDPEKLTAASLKTRLQATRIGYQHSLEVNDAWGDAQKKGMRSFAEFKQSPEYKDLAKRQYYETAKALNVTNPPAWNPKREADATAAPESNVKQTSTGAPSADDLRARLAKMKQGKQ